MIDLKTQAAREVARLIASHPTPEQVIAFHPSPEASNRAYALIDAEREGTLTEEEQDELASYTLLENLMEMAKIEARHQLQQRAS
jgi:hypothetical protein